MNLKTIVPICISVGVSALILVVSPNTRAKEPESVYRVYLKGKSIGLVEEPDSLEEYIDKEQETLKKKYDVDRVYAPEDLKIVKDITYDEKISTTKQIYEKIKDIEPFTVKGYSIFIKGIDTTNEAGDKIKGKDQTLYVLDKKVFEESMDNTIRSFVESENYDKYLENTQKEIKTTGTIIEDLSIENKVVVKEYNIPTDKKIYENTEDLSKYLLFGTTDENQKYTVKAGDTISDVAFNNKLSTTEFLIANPEFQDENSLLFEGQEVTINIIQPQFRLAEVDHTVFDQEIPYETEVKYDENKYVGDEEVIQKGENGLQRVTSKVQKINGQTENSVINDSATKVLKEPVKEIVVKGNKQAYRGGSSGANPNLQGNTKVEGNWRWPTITPYTINSGFGYRWGVLHDGVDIGVPGGSPIYAANNGIVVESGYKWPNGNYVLINHNNGYYTMYAHMMERYASVGQNVSIGQKIGAVGKTGMATGYHLHFGLYKGYPGMRGSGALYPLSLF